MILVSPEQLEYILIEEVLWIAKSKIGVPIYDFEFENFFACRHPIYLTEPIKAVGRFGVSENYSELYSKLKADQIELIHTPEQYLLASELTNWYPYLQGLTPKSLWFDAPPAFSEVEKHFDYPIFIKGSRQTNRHKQTLSVANSRKELEEIAKEYKQNPVLHWQKFVVREVVKLRKVEAKQTEKITPSFEFRTFWWKGELVGAGSYWKDFANYNWSESEKFHALKIAKLAVDRLNLPFVVIDIAQTEKGDWIVIECNDAQESGYANISPISLWQNVVEIEKQNL
ncbi:MAG: ATP-grasp domain-containing protein [Pyrinomonadaceae bacterium]|nr:ATP-grasp domain-containing protein [Pyrinomonadaceae bacterium]